MQRLGLDKQANIGIRQQKDQAYSYPNSSLRRITLIGQSWLGDHGGSTDSS
jgi:hypothetical protein